MVIKNSKLSFLYYYYSFEIIIQKIDCIINFKLKKEQKKNKIDIN